MKPNLYKSTIKRRQSFKTGFLLTSFGITVMLNLIMLGAIAVAYLVWLPPVR